MKRSVTVSAPLVAAMAFLGGCGINSSGGTPSVTKATLSGNKLTFAVGTANVAADGVVGLNVVAALRQGNGLSGTLANTPAIVGPPGFVVPSGAPSAYSTTASGANVDVGTNHISGSPQVPLNNAGLINSTLGTFTGVFAYGLGPLNSDQSGVTGYYPGNPNASPGNGFLSSAYVTPFTTPPYWALPLGSKNAVIFLGGPPAYPFFNDGVSAPLKFAGYSEGFVPFEVPPQAGEYALTVNVAAQNVAPTSYAARAILSSTTPLGAPTLGAFTEDGKGGGSGTITVPDPRSVETLVDVEDSTANLFYSVLLKGTGAQTYVLPAALGPCNGSGCQNVPTLQKPSIVTGDTYTITAVAFDYPAFEAGIPGRLQQVPVITGPSGQADLAISTSVTGTY